MYPLNFVEFFKPKFVLLQFPIHQCNPFQNRFDIKRDITTLEQVYNATLFDRFVVGSRVHSAFMLGLPILREQIRGFSKKWPIKRQRGEKHVIGGIYLESNRVFWAIIRANRLTGVACSLHKESKKTKEKKSHSTCAFHYHVETPLLIWSKPNFAGLVYHVTLSPTK